MVANANMALATSWLKLAREEIVTAASEELEACLTCDGSA
jgi:hypothetical protein